MPINLPSALLRQVAEGTRCYAAALDTYGSGAPTDGTSALSYASALLVHENDVHCLPRDTVTCGPADQAILQCFFPASWNATLKPCASQFYTCSAGVPSQVRQSSVVAVRCDAAPWPRLPPAPSATDPRHGTGHRMRSERLCVRRGPSRPRE